MGFKCHRSRLAIYVSIVNRSRKIPRVRLATQNPCRNYALGINNFTYAEGKRHFFTIRPGGVVLLPCRDLHTSGNLVTTNSLIRVVTFVKTLFVNLFEVTHDYLTISVGI